MPRTPQGRTTTAIPSPPSERRAGTAPAVPAFPPRHEKIPTAHLTAHGRMTSTARLENRTLKYDRTNVRSQGMSLDMRTTYQV